MLGVRDRVLGGDGKGNAPEKMGWVVGDSRLLSPGRVAWFATGAGCCMGLAVAGKGGRTTITTYLTVVIVLDTASVPIDNDSLGPLALLNRMPPLPTSSALNTAGGSRVPGTPAVMVVRTTVVPLRAALKVTYNSMT